MKVFNFLFIISLFIMSCNTKPNTNKRKGKTDGKLYQLTDKRGTIEDKQSPAIIKRQNLLLNPEMLRQESFTLNLFGKELTAIKRANRSPKETGATKFSLKEDPNAFIMIGESKGVYSINFNFSNGKKYIIRHIGNKVYQLREIDTSKLLKEGHKDIPQTDGDENGNPCGIADSPFEIDVMVVYTNDVLAAVPDVATIESEVYLALYETNQAYINSNVDQRVYLVYLGNIDYNDSGDADADLDALQDESDGIMDEVHTLRDTHRADLVSLWTEDSDSGGLGYTMEGIFYGDGFEDFAFSVVKRFEATSQFSFAHELGHNMGASHDCYLDTSVDPFDYSHGFTNGQLTDGWRTILAYDNACDDAGLTCPRIMYFSNPNINNPADGLSMGLTGTACNADNHLALNNSATVVSGFRCRSNGEDNVWMKDRWEDTGLEPDPATTGMSMCKSPYIWNRNDNDGEVHQHQHQNPIFGETNWLYVKMQNGGPEMSGDLELYYADASATLTWPVGWTNIATIPVTMATNDVQIIEHEWDSIPSEGHYCLVARWVSIDDPMAVVEGSSIGTNTRNNNNIVWKNMNVVAPLPGADEDAVMRFTGMNRTELVFLFDETRENEAFIKYGKVTITPDKETLNLIKKGNIKLEKVKKLGDGRFAIGRNSKLVFQKMDGKNQGKLNINFHPSKSSPKKKYFLDVQHRYLKSEGEVEIGNVNYTINLEEQS